MLDRKKNHAHLVAFIEHLKRSKNSAGDLVEKLISRGQRHEFNASDCFESPSAQDFDVFLRSTAPSVHKGQTLGWPLVGGYFNPPSYLPIRAFRGDTSRLWEAVDKLRIFLSSGTNSGAEGRSRSAFTPEGLHFYRAASLASFLGVLESRVLPFSANFLNMSLISLVPPVDNWPDSSLAQMIGWFSEIWPTRYVSDGDVDTLAALLHEQSVAHKPVCIFGTAFHFVNLLDQWNSRRCPGFTLPEGSLMVETGGTKGRSRALGRHELYEMMKQAFGISEAAIASEYGMCELASQAWDFVNGTASHGPDDHRSFKFPWWVKSAIMTDPSQIETVGTGALLLQDFARIDLHVKTGPMPIQTEDLVELRRDRSFMLHGRVPNAPLKGCSMLAENTVALDSTLPKTRSKSVGKRLNFNPQRAAQNALTAQRWFLDICSDAEGLKRLANELKSDYLARQAISDLSAGLPSNTQSFVTAAQNAVASSDYSQNWMMIAPASHSLALLQPIAAAMILGLKLRIRVPKIGGLKEDQTFLWRAIDLARSHGFEIIRRDATWRLGQDDLDDGEQIIIFGDDETCAKFRMFAPGRVYTFGHTTSLTLASIDALNDSIECQKIIRDQLALRQRGCLASRGIVVFGGEPDMVTQSLYRALPAELLTSTASPGEMAAWSMELVRLSQLGFHVVAGTRNEKTAPNLAPNQETATVLIAAKKTTLKNLENDVQTGISRLEMVIPVFILPENTDEITGFNHLPKSLAIRALSVSSKIWAQLKESKKITNFPDNIRLAAHGSLDSPCFDGTHLGVPFFASRT